MDNKFKIPHFESEAEEARWWSNHRTELAKAFENAAARNKVRTASAARLAKQRALGATPTTTIRLDPRDISRARRLAARRGLRYQTYLKMLIHEALDAREKRAG